MSDNVTTELFENKFSDLKEFIAEKFETNKQEHDKIDVKVTATNGRVKKLEIWRAGLLGAWAVITIIFPFMFIYFVNDIKRDIDNQITNAININNNRFFELDEN